MLTESLCVFEPIPGLIIGEWEMGMGITKIVEQFNKHMMYLVQYKKHKIVQRLALSTSLGYQHVEGGLYSCLLVYVIAMSNSTSSDHLSSVHNIQVV